MTNEKNMHEHTKETSEYHSIDYTLELPAVVDGEIIPIEEVEDQIFSGKLIGDGYGIRPTGKYIFAPVDARIEQIAATKHAIYLRTEENMKLLIHLGIDTIELKGEGFISRLEKGAFVEKGDTLVEMDLSFIEEEGFNPVVSVIILELSGDHETIEVYPTKHAIGNETIALRAKI